VVKHGVRHRFLNMLREYAASREARMAVMEPNRQRSQIKPRIRVRIGLKQHQRSGKLTEGIFKTVLNNSSTYRRGIKLRLIDGKVGRVILIIK